ncbi:hypothetical protein EJ08DRAFT_596495 [Tothia fuscella]|uniref:Uncharacterized protein n=1 Tax=Tothia fuscella TaxID=1048955 RepID=A0A9P4NIW8_9PEZI|nr:hypothetical protein EJ08DRAFT_596495 [Tothia fuscella]
MSPTTSNPPPPNNTTLQVDFAWLKMRSLITRANDPTNTPLYTITNKALAPHLVFRKGSDTKSQPFGTGTLHPVTIHADCTLNTHAMKVKALKRWQTSYTHLSHSFAPRGSNTPMEMTWTSTSDWKNWDFICLNDKQEAVAKFVGNIWGLKRIGWIEFMGEEGEVTEEMRDEIVVTGLTLFYQMVLRASNFLNFVGAVFAKPGRLDVPTAGGGDGREGVELDVKKTR